MAERMVYLEAEMGWLRKVLTREPGGHRDMSGCSPLPPVDPSADTGLIFIDGGRYDNMCGHVSRGISAMSIETGRVA